MSKIIFLLAILFVFSCKKEEKPQYAIFSGTIENNTAESAIVRGYGFEATLPIQVDGTFSDTLDIGKDGFYDLVIGRERTGIYLEKGSNLSVSINIVEFDESLLYTGSIASENNFIAEKYLWNERNLDFEALYLKNENEFLQALNENQKTLDSLFTSKNIENEKFIDLIAEEDVYANALKIEDYQEAHRYYSGNSDFTPSPGLYSKLQHIEYNDTVAYRNSATYQNLLSTYYNRLSMDEWRNDETQSFAITYLTRIDSELPDGYAKDKLMNDFLQFGLSPDEFLDETYSIYKNSNPDPENLTALTERYNKLKTITKGNPSPGFDYENHKGGTTALADLKGKYIYVDVWATWCGPCIREIPFLKEVEEAYHGKNIEFVSISIDTEKDYEKWKAMVSEKQLGGIQLIADNNWKSKFVEDYAIMGIPRFILIDPQGNIVSADAPRPSDPKLRVMLDEMI